MATTIYNGTVTVHASEAIEVSGAIETKNGLRREISIYLTTEQANLLRETFRFANAYGNNIHLGHAFWHVTNHKPDLCESCPTG